MNLDQYEFNAGSNHLDYEFYSDGPKGEIKKVVRFTAIANTQNRQLYNLGFGDWNEKEKRIDDFIVSDNKDAEKVLGTVAALVLLFTDQFRDAVVFAQGNSPAKTRRYQMGLNKYWSEINQTFVVFGLIQDQGFVPFNKGINYDAFLVRRRKK